MNIKSFKQLFLKYIAIGMYLISLPVTLWAQDVSVSSVDERSYQLQFRLNEYQFEMFDKIKYNKIDSSGVVPTVKGGIVVPQDQRPLLPQTGFSLILPKNAHPNIQMIGAKTETINNIHIPVYQDTVDDDQSNQSQQKDHSIVTYGGVQMMSGVPFHSFQIKPFQYDPQTEVLKIYQHLDFRISVSNQLPPEIQYSGTEHFPDSYRSFALNGDQVVFRKRPTPLHKEQTQDWYRPDQPYLKIFVSEDGIYHIRREDIAVAGISPQQINPKTLTMYYKGEPYPIYVKGEKDDRFDETDYIEFYGRRNPGIGQYYNEYSDTSVYWLTWGEQTGLRITSHSVKPYQGIQTDKFYHCEHHEVERFYYSGDNSLAVFNTDRSPGEGWIGKKIYAGDVVSFKIKVRDYLENGWADSLVLKFRGMTDDQVKPDHHIEILINDQPVSEFSFDGVKDFVQETKIPNGIIKEGNNSVSIRSIGDTGAEYDAIYFDWCELYYTRELTAQDNRLDFTRHDDYDNKPVTFSISNFTQDSVVIYDATHLEKLVDFRMNSENNRYSVSMTDSAEAGTRYVLCAANTIGQPDRIVLDRSSNLRNPNHQADYLIVTHRTFRQQADELARYRQQTQGVTPLVADIENIYDEFNDGFFDPMAIRSFIQYAVANWQAPSPKYVLLFGDASWDYKKNAYNSVKENYVPSYGHPVSDTRLVSLEGDEDFLPDLHVGRLAVESVEEAQHVVDKIKTYDSAPDARWRKNVIFLNGGFDEWEQNLFEKHSEELIDHYVQPPPFGGNPVRLYLEGRQLGGMASRISSAINEGALWLSFVGHAGSRTWDLMFDFPDVQHLSNEERMPFITSMTCHTARFANPVNDCFGEAFVNIADRGAIGFFGTSGWGYIFQDHVLLDELFRIILQGDIRSLGEAVTLTKLNLWNKLGYSEVNISTIEQYTLLGDPVQQIAVPDKPDFVLHKKDVAIGPEEPTENDSTIQVAVRFFNDGLVPEDSVDIAFSLQSASNGQKQHRTLVSVPPPLYSTDIDVMLPIQDLVGETVLSVAIDPDHTIEETHEENNSAERSFYIYSTSISISTPPRFAVINERKTNLKVYSPEISINKKRQYYFELDTVKQFDSSFLIQSEDLKERPIVTKWNPSYLLDDGVYYWRCKILDESEYTNWIYSQFEITDNQKLIGWNQNINTGFEKLSNISHNFKRNNLILNKNPEKSIYLEVRSAGVMDGNYCYIIFNNIIFNRTYGEHRGHNFLVIDPVNIEIISGPVTFDTWGDPNASDSLASYIRKQPEYAIILAGIRDEGTKQLNEVAYQALESIGSAYIRELDYKSSWAIIGKKGADIGTVPESWSKKGEGSVTISDTIKNHYYGKGTIFSNDIGPATDWHQLDWQVTLPHPETRYALELWAYDKRAKTWQLYQQFSDQRRTVSLEELDADHYSRIKLKMHLYSEDELHTPAFSGWHVAYDFPPDLATHPDLFLVKKDSVLEGAVSQIEVPIYNAGMADAESVSVRLDIRNESAGWDSMTTNTVHEVQKDDSSHTTLHLPTAGYPGLRTFRVVIDPANQWNELSETNNQYTGKVFIRSDSVRPGIKITFDDREILPGDLVSPEPVIHIEVDDNSPLAMTDTALVELFLDAQPVYYEKNQARLEFQPQPAGSSEGSGVVITYRPKLESGEHVLEVIAKDATENPTYTRTDFKVETEFSLLHLMNYPNPFVSKTYFTYDLTHPADVVSLSVYTLAGRKILELENLPGQPGHNSYQWNGQDADGDRIANGVYLYRLKAHSGEESVSQIGKMVVMK